jgi:Spy/CpxP family protein refolding chaperone
MKKSWIVVLTMTVAVLVAIPFAHAGMARRAHGHYGGGGMAGHHAGAFFGHLRALHEKLDLSEAQTEQIKQIAAEVHEQNANYVSAIHDDVQAVADVLIADPNAVDKAESLLKQNAEARRQVGENILRGVSRALKVLTPEQRDKLADLVAEHREQMKR